MGLQQVLRIRPEHELRFRGPFNVPSTSMMQISNPTDQTVCFKIKTTAKPRYCVLPNMGVLQPGKRIHISVTLQPGDMEPTVTKVHKFLVQSIIGPEGGPNPDTDRMWAEVDVRELMKTKLRCSFDLNENVGMDPSNSTSQRSDTSSEDQPVAQTNGGGCQVSVQEIGALYMENVKLKDEVARLHRQLESYAEPTSLSSRNQRRMPIPPLPDAPPAIVKSIISLFFICGGMGDRGQPFFDWMEEIDLDEARMQGLVKRMLRTFMEKYRSIEELSGDCGEILGNFLGGGNGKREFPTASQLDPSSSSTQEGQDFLRLMLEFLQPPIENEEEILPLPTHVAPVVEFVLGVLVMMGAEFVPGLNLDVAEEAFGSRVIQAFLENSGLIGFQEEGDVRGILGRLMGTAGIWQNTPNSSSNRNASSTASRTKSSSASPQRTQSSSSSKKSPSSSKKSPSPSCPTKSPSSSKKSPSSSSSKNSHSSSSTQKKNSSSSSKPKVSFSSPSSESTYSSTSSDTSSDGPSSSSSSRKKANQKRR